ncbi:MAG: Gfo/Idh/MocA family oxidoreductase [Deltaproteobacteria bacterium]|nr:Gfo/Idh/MocA family oxidoreductase [Deltaproteobacteria bacterium]
METVRVGIIGSGNISNAHVTAFRAVPGVEVVAQHSRNPERGRAFCENNRIPDRHDKLEDLLARDDVHAVTVALANHVHAEYTLAAIEAGKHVIVEKPLCLAMDDGRRMVDAARERGVVLGYAEELCYLPKFVRARELADAGAVGDPFSLNAR